ncbi:MAG: hypothetical protein PVG79_02245 [Gemmatimonadales bacterium]|jgi:hypothetical protein
MFKRAISTVLILLLLPQFTGCMSVYAVDLADVERPVAEEVYGVITDGGQRVDFDRASNDIRNDTIYATVGHSPYAIALDDVQQLRLRRRDARTTAIVVVLAVVSVLAIGAVIEGAFADWEDWKLGDPN